MNAATRHDNDGGNDNARTGGVPSNRNRRRATMAAACAAALLGAVCLVQAAAPDAAAVAFPDGYRQWNHVKSGLIDDPAHPAFAATGGLHHIYANALAMRGYREAAFPDGSVLVYDLHELRTLANGSIDQGPRRHIDVMVKDARRYAETGGWGYQEFTAGDPRKPALTSKVQAICAACHIKDGRQDHVFSEYRE